MPGKRAASASLSPPPSPASVSKKLRRLPHVFSKVLELPFDSDADVDVEDRPDCLRFVAAGVNISGAGGVLAHVVEVHPGMTKVVIRRREDRARPLVDELELNIWQFRLPEAAMPELAKAVYEGGRLVVTVPKNGWRKVERCVDEFRGGFFGRDKHNHMGNTLVLV